MFKLEQTLIKYLKNTGWLLLERAIQLLSGLFIGAWIARYLGPEKFGMLAYAIALVGMIGSVAGLGMDNLLVKAFVEQKNKAGEILGTSCALRSVGAVLTFFIVATVALITSDNPGEWKIILVMSVSILFLPLNVIDFFFQSQVLAQYTVYASILSIFIAAAIKITAIFANASLEVFAAIAVLEAGLFSMTLCYFYLKKNRIKSAWRINRALSADLLRQGWPLIFSGLIVSVYMKIDQVMIQQMLGNASAGQYAAGIKISSAFFFLPMVLAKSFFPAILDSRTRSQEMYLNRLQRLYSVANWVAIIIAVPVSLFGNQLTHLLYGDKYLEAGAVLQIHIWGLLFIGIQTIGGRWVIAENHQRLALVRATIGMLANIVLNYVLIRMYGVVGAAISTVFAYMFVGYLSNLMFRSHIKHFNLITRSFVDIYQRNHR